MGWLTFVQMLKTVGVSQNALARQCTALGARSVGGKAITAPMLSLIAHGRRECPRDVILVLALLVEKKLRRPIRLQSKVNSPIRFRVMYVCLCCRRPYIPDSKRSKVCKSCRH
jgi:hypothetical protein